MRAGLDIVGLTVCDESGRRTGTVSDVLLDDGSRRVIGVVVRRGRLRPQHEFVGFQQIRSIRPDRLIAGAGRACSECEDGRNALQGKPVVSRTGRHLGWVDDVYIDETTGDVMAYQIASKQRRAPNRPRLLILSASRPMIADVMVVADP
jgi:uncharacterized protein YrrD